MSAYSGIYTDMRGLAELRTQAQRHPDATLAEVAGQFEALFTQMMLKTMRASSLNSDLFGDPQKSSYTEMFDGQVALAMSRGRGLGLKQALIDQLGGNLSARGPAPEAHAAADWRPESKTAFVDRLRPLALEVERELGIAHEAVLAQAALESGWGQHSLRRPDGSNTFNLFGIKADPAWQGEKVASRTLEFDAGVATRRTESFRAYGSLEEAVRDYADFIRANPRYRQAIERGGDPHAYARELQAAGYATDPRYADKITAILDSGTVRHGA